MGGVSAEGGGFVLDGVPIEEIESKVAQGGKNHGGRAGANAAVVFAEGHIADVEHAVLDPPVLSGQAEERIGIGSIRRQGGDAVPRFGGGLAAQRSLTNQPERLGQVRPIDVVPQRGAARQGACFDATVRFGGGRGGLTLGGDELSLPGGKRHPWRRHR